MSPPLARSATARPISRRLREMAGGGPFESPEDIRARHRQLSATSTTGGRTTASSRCARRCTAPRITCIDAAILSYGLLELLFPDVKRRLLAIHRRDPAKDEECGHCVALYWGDDGQGRLVLASRASRASATAMPSSPTRSAIATSYAEAYVEMGFQPLYFGVTTLEEAAPDLDWRFHDGRPERALRAPAGDATSTASCSS